MFSGNVIFESDEHPRNESWPRLLTLDGIMISGNFEHSWNALFLIIVTESGIVTFVNDEHPRNASWSIIVVSDEIIISCSVEHSRNAFLGMILPYISTFGLHS